VHPRKRGAINSPQLLLLSGVGPAADLKRLGIPETADLPGVGENLYDHPVVLLNYECKKPITMAAAESLGSLARYLLFRRGPLTSNLAEAGGFFKIRSEERLPDLQFHFVPTYYMNHGFDNPEGHGFA